MKDFLLITLFFISFSSVAQMKQRVADDFYAKEEYAKCVEMYDELVEKAISGHKKGKTENIRKAAESHFHLFQMEEAIVHYKQLYTRGELTEHDRMHFIDALRFSEEYDFCTKIARESAQSFPENTFFARFVANENNFYKLFSDSSFYKVTEASINSGKGDFSPAFYGHSLVFSSKSKNAGFLTQKYGWDDAYYLNIMQSNFEEDSVLQTPKMLKNHFVSKAHDGPVSFNENNTEMIITQNTLGKKKGKEVIVLSLYFSYFKDGEWGELIPFPYNNEKYNVGHGVLSHDGTKLYFVSDMPGGYGETDIYVSRRMHGAWSEPENLGTMINTERKEMCPFVEEGKLYFASNGHFGLGGLDIFETSLESNSTPKNIGYPVNTSKDDFGLIFDHSGRLGFLSSNRGDHIDRIYHVVKRKANIQLIVNVFEKYKELEFVPEQPVTIKNMVTNEELVLLTDSLGVLNTSIDANTEYRIYTSKEEFVLVKEASVQTEQVRTDTTFVRELILKPTTIQIHIRVVEKGTGKIIPFATTTITDYGSQTDTTLTTDENGMVTIVVDRNKTLWAHGSKKGFIDADISFNTANENDKVFDVELALSPIRKGETFKLENIFYDLNKSTLREESKASLDKLAQFLLDNDLKIELSAHTDSRGSSAYNKRLSQARAQSCVDYLLSKGVAKKNIRAKGYGETRLVNRCRNGVKCSEEEHQENRRTEVKILEVN